MRSLVVPVGSVVSSLRYSHGKPTRSPKRTACTVRVGRASRGNSEGSVTGNKSAKRSYGFSLSCNTTPVRSYSTSDIDRQQGQNGVYRPSSVRPHPVQNVRNIAVNGPRRSD